MTPSTPHLSRRDPPVAPNSPAFVHPSPNAGAFPIPNDPRAWGSAAADRPAGVFPSSAPAGFSTAGAEGAV